MRVGDGADQRGCYDRTNARDLLQPSAELTRAMPGLNALLELADLPLDALILLGKTHQADPRGLGDAEFLRSIHHFEKPPKTEAPDGCDDPELGQLATDRIAQHRALMHEQLAGSVQHESALLLLALSRYEPHRGPRHGLADRSRIIGVVLRALQISLYVTRRHQLHGVTQRLQLTAPMMCRRAGLDAH